MKIKIIKKKIGQEELRKFARETFGEMVKAVVDLGQGVLAIGGELHADEEALLLKNGSRQENLWGINIYPDKPRNQRIEYSALINIRPSLGYRSMEIKSPEIRKKIKGIVDRLIGRSL